ncbi:MAG: ATP-binding protein [Pyrinomonadaceae bacterium]
MSEKSISYKRVLLLVILALLASTVALIICRTVFVPWLVQTLVLPPPGEMGASAGRGFAIVALILSAFAFAAALVVQKLGLQRSWPYLVILIAGLVTAHVLSARFFSFDVLLIPLALTIALAVISVHALQLWSLNERLTERLIHSSSNLNSLQADETSARLNSSLKLLDTMLSPQEIIVFQRDLDGKLVTAARLRANGVSLDSSRNSAWRDGIELCEQSLERRALLTQKVGNDNSGTNVAVPMRHEKQSVGALLVRLANELGNDDRALLNAVGVQLARNLQRQEASKSVSQLGKFGYLSASAGQRRLDLLVVVNGLLSEQRFGMNALAEIQDGIALAYLDGTIAYVNNPLLDLVRLPQEEAHKLTLFDLLDTLRTDIFDEPTIAVRRVLQTGEAYEGELQLTEPAGTFGLRISLVLDQLGPTGSIAEPLCLAITVRDLTRLKGYEQLKSDMISLMSHELRTPLTSINGFAELLTADDELPEQAKEFVGIIASESQRMSRMINTFLALTQLERKDRQEVLKIPLRLDDVVRETVLHLQPSARKKRIRLVEQPNQRVPPVAADKSLISQAVKNLVSNAIKYSPERTTVTVSTALEAEAVRVSVEDRGYGIPAEARDRVWEKFYRVVREGQEKDEDSTGLGLSFVREVVEQHGGAVKLETEEGRGSKFSFTLPRL